MVPLLPLVEPPAGWNAAEAGQSAEGTGGSPTASVAGSESPSDQSARNTPGRRSKTPSKWSKAGGGLGRAGAKKGWNFKQREQATYMALDEVEIRLKQARLEMDRKELQLEKRREFVESTIVPVRDPTTWTILEQDSPNHLGL